MRVLVVEDEYTVARFLKQALEEEGHAVDAAADGAEGGNLAHVNEYDLILLDVQLPKLDGLQLAAELRGAGSRGVGDQHWADCVQPLVELWEEERGCGALGECFADAGHRQRDDDKADYARRQTDQMMTHRHPQD